MMDTGTRWLIAILTLVVLILIDWSWYRSYYLNQVVRTIRLLTG